MAKRPIITHEVTLRGFDEPLIEPRLIRRGLRRAGTVVEDELEEVIRASHHDTGQLEESVNQSPVDMEDQSVTVKFKGKRRGIRHRRKKDGSQGAQYQRWNKTVAFFLNFYKKFYDRNKDRIQQKAVDGFKEEIAKKRR